jgi:hypothetical protein
MGFKEWVADVPVATFGPFHLRKDSIERVVGEDKGKHPLAGVEVTLEDGEALRRRVTATRVLATGVFALALRKQSGGESFLTIQGDGFAWVYEVPAKKRGDAVKFVAKVRAQAHTVSA